MPADLALAGKAATTVGGKLAAPAGKAFWRWWRGGEIGELVRVLEKDFGPEIRRLPLQPDALGLFWVMRATGEVDQAAFATAIRPLWWKRGEDAAEDLSRRCAVVVADRYRDVLKDTALERFDARQILATLDAADVGRRARELETAERRLTELAKYDDLPHVREAFARDPNVLHELGVSPSTRAERHRTGRAGPPYIGRAADRDLELAFQASRFGVLSGASKTGKSRTALEYARAAFPDHRLLAPRARPFVHELLREANLDLRLMPDEPALLWLDDLDRYLAEDPILDDALFASVLRTWPALRVLGTIQRSHSTSLKARATLSIARVVPLPESLAPDERTRAARLYPSETISAGTRIGEYFVAADELVARIEAAVDDAGSGLGPHGAALVAAAVDLRRAGISRPLPKASLWRLFAGVGCDSYVRLRGWPGGRLTHEAFESALDAATAPVGSSIGALWPIDGAHEEAFDVYDFVVAYFSGETSFPHEADSVEDAALLVACEDLAEGSEDFVVMATLVSALPELGPDRQARLLTAVGRGVERQGIGADALLVSIRTLAKRRQYALVDALIGLAGQALRTGAPKANVLLGALEAVERSAPQTETILLAVAAGKPLRSSRLAAKLIARALEAGLSETATSFVRQLNGFDLTAEPLIPRDALALLVALCGHPGASGVDLAQRLLGMVDVPALDPGIRANLVVDLVRSDLAELAEPVARLVIADVSDRRVDGRLAARVALAMDQGGRSEDAEAIFDVLMERSAADTIPVKGQLELIGRLAQAGRVDAAARALDAFLPRLERTSITRGTITVVAKRLLDADRPDLARSLRDAATRGRRSAGKPPP